jgi:hypothetical protein
MSTPNFSTDYEWSELVRLRLRVRDMVKSFSSQLEQPVSGMLLLEMGRRLGQSLEAAARVGDFTSAQYALVNAKAKADTGDNDYDLAANVGALTQAATGIIALIRSILPADGDGYIGIIKLDPAGDQTVMVFSTAATNDLKIAFDQFAIALG